MTNNLLKGRIIQTLNFIVSQKHYNKIQTQNSIRINMFGYGKGQPFPIHISEEEFEDQMNLLLIAKDKKRHYILIKTLTRSCTTHLSIRRESTSACIVCNVFHQKAS